jgi:hypothetical protein
MASYVVMIPPGGDPQGERTRFIRDGFAFIAFVLPVVWFLWHRLWLWAVLFGLLFVATGYASEELGFGWLVPLASLCASIFAAIEGPALRVSKLRRLGWTDVAAFDAPDHRTAEEMYFAAADTFQPFKTNETPEPVRRQSGREYGPDQDMARPRQVLPLGPVEWNGGR